MTPSSRIHGDRESHQDSLVVIGGGVSGLAAAVAACRSGVRVKLLEQRPYCGGRAYSFQEQVTGETIDNGQHLLISGYRHTTTFLEHIGSAHLVDVQPVPELVFHHPRRGFRTFTVPDLPGKSGLIAGILTSGLFALPDRFRILRAALSMRNPHEHESLTIAQWLRTRGQSSEAVRSFWEPLAVSIMNESSERAPANVFLHALRQAFLEVDGGARVVLPRVGLSQLLVEPALDTIRRSGGDVRCNADVVAIEQNGERFDLAVKGGTALHADAVIVAVPWHRLNMILPEPVLSKELTAMGEVPGSSIVSVHLWFPSDVMPHRFVGVIGRTVQWIFNRRKIVVDSGKDGHVSAVVSAAGSLTGETNERILATILADIRSVYPNTPDPVHSMVIREKRATLALTPEVEKLRPGNRTVIPGLFLAGDWTNTGLPATIEGAILSGELAASHAIEKLKGAT